MKLPKRWQQNKRNLTDYSAFKIKIAFLPTSMVTGHQSGRKGYTRLQPQVLLLRKCQLARWVVIQRLKCVAVRLGNEMECFMHNVRPALLSCERLQSDVMPYLAKRTSFEVARVFSLQALCNNTFYRFLHHQLRWIFIVNFVEPYLVGLWSVMFGLSYLKVILIEIK